MRILLINKYHYPKGGAERAYFDTASILAENGHKIAFFSMAHPNNLPTPWQKYFVRQVDYLDEKQSFLSKIQAAGRILWNVEAARKLEQLIIEFSPDVAHLHNTYHQLSPSILWVLKRHRIPIVMTLHDYKAVSPNYSLFVRGKIWEHTSGWKTIIDRAIKDSLVKSVVCALELWLHKLIGSYRLVNQFIAPSKFLIQKYQALGFPFPIKQVVQPLSPFPQPPVQLGQGNYYLFAGRLSPEKGAETLLKAFAGLPNLKLMVAGTGPEEVRLKEQYGHFPNITFLGHLAGEPLAAVFREARAFVIPSEWYENMPYSMLEAFGYGLPVIGSRLGGITERVTDGTNGFLFEAGSVESLQAAIHRLEQSDRAALSRSAWESIQDLHDRVYYHNLLAMYRSVIDQIDTHRKN